MQYATATEQASAYRSKHLFHAGRVKICVGAFILFAVFFVRSVAADATGQDTWVATFDNSGFGVVGGAPGAGILKQMEREGLAIHTLANGTRALAADPVKTGLVRVVVRGPDGSLLKNLPIVIEPSIWQDPQWKLQLEGQTDATGQLKVPLAAALQALTISAPGIGIGQTGVFELRPRAVLDIPLPALAAFASAEITFDSGAKAVPGHIVCYSGFTKYCRVDTEKSGRFKMRDLPPCPCTFQYRSEDEKEYAIDGTDLRAGQTAHIVLHSNRADFDSSGPVLPRVEGQGTEQFELVRGNVRTAGGQPAPGVLLSAIAPTGELMVSGTTDNSGNYLLHYKGRGERDCFLTMQAAGHAMRMLPRTVGSVEGGQPPVIDWVVPGQGGTLEVRVSHNGQPVAGAAVSANLMDIWKTGDTGFPPHEEDEERIQRQLVPAQTTNAAGVAQFKDLQAGSYGVSASGESPRPFIAGPVDEVRVPENRVTKVSIDTDYGNTPLRFSDSDGHRLSGTSIERWLPADRTSSGDGWEGLTASTDLFHQQWNSRGLMAPQYRFRETPDPTHAYPVAEPFYQVTTAIAASRLLPHSRPIDLMMIRRSPSSLSVQLLGLNGQPSRGTILLPAWAGDFGRGASTDVSGRAVFEGLPSGDYPIFGQVDASKPLPELSLSADDSAYTDVATVPVATMRITADRHGELTEREELVGYVRGTIIPPPGHSPDEYGILHHCVDHRNLLDDGSPVAYDGHDDVLLDEKTGQFIVGPLMAGSEKFTLIRKAKEEETTFAAGTQSIQVTAGKLTRIEFHPTQVSKDDAYVSWPGYGTGQVTVLSSDRKTRATGARVEVYLPNTWWPYMTGVSDAAGHAFVTSNTSYGGEPKRRPTGSPLIPVVAAWLPGTSGAVVLPFDPFAKDLSLVLPPPISCGGRVTVGEKSTEGIEAVIHVLAAHENAGKLERAMNIRTTCSSDGSFELPGLTPGKYRVQAALDDVWLSKTIEVDAREPTPSAPLSLNIDPPGVGVSIHLLGPKWPQTPSPRIAIERPSGPLTEQLWPKDFEADGAGVVYLEGLEAGRHTMILPGGARQSFDVPPSDEEHRLPIDVNAPLSKPK